VVREGRVLTAPEFRTKDWAGFPLACALTDRLGKPARILNDAEVQGFGDIKGEGLEVVLTLGTGAGTAVFRNGELMPHLELAHHIIRGKMTYNDYVGLKALKAVGRKRWRHRVQRTVQVLSDLLHYDTLYVGGGNATKLKELGPNVVLASNDAGLTGGVRLWEQSPPAAGPTAAA
jgi:polyphosphate glucokinase